MPFSTGGSQQGGSAEVGGRGDLPSVHTVANRDAPQQWQATCPLYLVGIEIDRKRIVKEGAADHGNSLGYLVLCEALCRWCLAHDWSPAHKRQSVNTDADDPFT